jgi:hypothetical protein
MSGSERRWYVVYRQMFGNDMHAIVHHDGPQMPWPSGEKRNIVFYMEIPAENWGMTPRELRQYYCAQDSRVEQA